MKSLTVLANVLTVLLSMSMGAWLLWLWWTLVWQTRGARSRTFEVGANGEMKPVVAWWGPAILLALGLVMFLGPPLSVYMAYRKDRQEQAVRAALVDATNEFNRTEFVNQYNFTRMQLQIAAVYTRTFARALRRSDSTLPPSMVESMRDLDEHMDSFLVHMTTTRFSDSLRGRPHLRLDYFTDGHSLHPGGSEISDTRWAHPTDTALMGIVTVDRGRFAFDGYLPDSALRSCPPPQCTYEGRN